MIAPRRIPAALAALALLAGVAPAQRPDEAREAERAEIAKDAAVLTGRDREILHPEFDPVRLRALDQSVEGFRRGTPALQRADTSVAKVDVDEMRRRRLAMYEGGERFDAPVPTSRDEPERDEPEPAPRTAPPEEDPEGGTPLLPILACLGAVAGVVGAIVLRRR